MKSLQNISLLLNLVLAGCLVVVLTHLQKESVVATSSAVNKAITSTQSAAVPAHSILTRQPPKPFQWSQLESTNDYRVFVANLRAIGCPEPTVQDIVRGDAWRGFSFQRKQLGLDGSGTGKWSRFQEAQTVASLLGESMPVAETTGPAQNTENQSQPAAATAVAEASVGTPISGQPSEAPAGRASTPQSADQQAAYAPSYPLVFQNVNADAIGLNDSQKAAVKQLQQQFVNDLGGTNQDTSTPAYLAKWQQAQTQSDAMLEYQIGYNPYMQYWLAEYQNSLTSQGASPQ